MAFKFDLKGLLEDENFLIGAGLLTAGSKGQSLGEAAFPTILQAAKVKKTFADTAKTTKSVFSIKDNKNVLASDIEISKDKANYLPATKAKDLSVNDLGINVYRKLDGLTGDAFDAKLKSLPQNEQDVYAKIIKGNEDWFSSLIKDNIKNNKSEMPDLSGYQVTEKSKGKSIEDWITASKGMNKDMSVEEIIENLISNGIITAR
tara:strand:- start:1599 stop:2210 length:612 start_codon:yes stop_codon:yes gene_type:complete